MVKPLGMPLIYCPGLTCIYLSRAVHIDDGVSVRTALSAMSYSAWSSLSSTSVCTLDFACNILRLNTSYLPSKRYLIDNQHHSPEKNL